MTDGFTSDALPAAVVATVSVVVPFAPAAIVTLAGFKLQVGKLTAPVGELASAHVIFIVPEYVLLADSVTVAVVLAPGATGEGAGTVITTCETVTVAVPVAIA
jgi:hypothetical protein